MGRQATDLRILAHFSELCKALFDRRIGGESAFYALQNTGEVLGDGVPG
jgi:hypothetical protein